MSQAGEPLDPQRECAGRVSLDPRVCPGAVRPTLCADKRLNVFSYSEERINDYVEMLDWLGYSGCQLMESCYTYSVFGLVAAAHEWQLRVASAAKRTARTFRCGLGCAEFSGFGWVEPDAVYEGSDGRTAFEDPQVRRLFEKYYDGYGHSCRSPISGALLGG